MPLMKFNLGKNSLALLCILAGAVYLIILVPIIIESVEGGIQGAKKGYRSAINNEVEKPYNDFGNDTYFLKLRIKEKGNYYPDSILNTATQKMIPVRFKTVEMYYDYKESPTLGSILLMMFLILGGFPVMVLLVCIPILFYKLIISLYQGNVFTPKNIQRIRRIGFFCIIVYVYLFLYSIQEYFQAKAVIDLEKYTIVFPEFGNETLLFGVIALIVAVVMKRAMELKEEQDLTI